LNEWELQRPPVFRTKTKKKRKGIKRDRGGERERVIAEEEKEETGG
jgi:hypothetical protein